MFVVEYNILIYQNIKNNLIFFIYFICNRGSRMTLVFWGGGSRLAHHPVLLVQNS